MKNKSLSEKIEELRRENDAELGVWSPRGGVATSVTAICNRTGADLVAFIPANGQPCGNPHDGRKAVLSYGTERVTLTQHWHGGPESGDWWWTL